MPSPVTPSVIINAPKALLHDHLDGGLRIGTILELSDSIGWTSNLPTTNPDDLQAWFTAGAAAKDLLQYLATFEHTLAVMQTTEHIERIAFEAVEDLANDGVVYAEIRFAPELHNMPFAASTEAICAGFRRAEESARAREQQISAHLIICAMRTEHRSVEVVEFVDQYRTIDSKVVAFDLAGAETGWPPSLHAEALTIARQRHINLTIHASEPPDLELISDALAHGAHRIGHGVRLDRDTHTESGELTLGPLATYVRDRQVHLEMAPTCNTQIGAVASVGDHPVIPFLRAGFNVGVNTDNRLMSDVSPSSELIALNNAHNLTWEEISRLVTNAISSGFAPLDERQRIINDIVSPAYSVLVTG
jgi:adenosine deaminase